MLVSIVIPCYKSENNIREVVEMTQGVFDTLPGYDCEFVLVDDCSPDNTFVSIKQLAAEYPNVVGLSLMRNFGQHNAIMCGLNHVRGDFALGMDDDLQTHPSQIPAIIRKMEEGYDIVYGVYKESTNGVAKKFTSWLNRVTAQKLLGRPKDQETSNFWMITRPICEEVVKYTNYNPYIQALFGRMTNRIGMVEIEHHERMSGSSNYTLGKLAKLWMGYFNYTVVPLRFVSGVGVLTALVGFLWGICTLIHKLVVPDVPAGWTSVICVLLLFCGLILLALGIIGEYLGDLVLSANSTPQFVVRETTYQPSRLSRPQDDRAQEFYR
ncbi:MAG: glycosyltransferase family 2 protein [Coriobacteriia bacterium]|nr:glycosyltransferase family 2 protein [Coriobacteriia bacterium]